MSADLASKLIQHDREFGVRFVAGADEAGRGSLAGPLSFLPFFIQPRYLFRAQIPSNGT